MQIKSILSFTGLLALTSALPSSVFQTRDASQSGSQCLAQADAQYLTSGFQSLLNAYTDANANKYLSAGDFTDTSESINRILEFNPQTAGTPLNGITFPSRDAFKAGQGPQPPVGFQIVNIDAVTCNTIVFRWTATFGKNIPVRGINILVADKEDNYDGNGLVWKIKTVYSEFNSISWLENIGGTCSIGAQ